MTDTLDQPVAAGDALPRWSVADVYTSLEAPEFTAAMERSSAEATDPMRPEEGARVLVVHLTPHYLPFVAGDFTVFRTVEHLTIPLGGGVNREMEISVGEGFAPAPRDAAFLERLQQRPSQ